MPEVDRAVVIEELALVRAGIASVLRESRVAVVAEASSAGDAAGLVRGTNAHLLVVGPSEDAELADAITRVRSRQPEVRVVALVSGDHRAELMAVLDAGADAVLPLRVERDELVEAVKAVGRGERYLSPVLTALLFAAVPVVAVDLAADEVADVREGVLTPRERTIVRLLAAGHANDEIGRRLFISPATVKSHLSNIYEKLGARNRYDAVVKATQLQVL